MKIYPGKWPIHFSILLDLRIEGANPTSYARHARAFRFSGAPVSAAATAGRGDELTTYVYEIYCICVANLLQRPVRGSSGPHSLRERRLSPLIRSRIAVCRDSQECRKLGRPPSPR